MLSRILHNMLIKEINIKLLVIAGNYNEYRQYLRETGYSRKKAIYIGNKSKLYGWHPTKVRVIRCGQWWKNRVAHKHIATINWLEHRSKIIGADASNRDYTAIAIFERN